MGIIPIINEATSIITDILIPIAFSLCLLFFFWGVVKYIWGIGNEKEEGRKIMIWGVVGLFVAFSIWAVITFIRSEFGIPKVDNVELVNSNVIY